MREVKGLAQVMRSTIAGLKQAHITATERFTAEVTASQANLAKVKAFTDELASSNKEVEAMLGETGSNFPTSEGDNLSAPDQNGVRLNLGPK